jgi:excisionase family DNA binding protein
MRLRRIKPAYTTEEVGSLIGLSGNAVRRIADQGLLPSYRIPGSLHRRISHAALVDWLKAQGEPYAFALDQLGALAESS